MFLFLCCNWLVTHPEVVDPSIWYLVFHPVEGGVVPGTVLLLQRDSHVSCAEIIVTLVFKSLLSLINQIY